MFWEDPQFYLHTNGKVIYKKLGMVDKESPFVVRVWQADYVCLSPETFADFMKEIEALDGDISSLSEICPEEVSYCKEKGLV